MGFPELCRPAGFLILNSSVEKFPGLYWNICNFFGTPIYSAQPGTIIPVLNVGWIFGECLNADILC